MPTVSSATQYVIRQYLIVPQERESFFHFGHDAKYEQFRREDERHEKIRNRGSLQITPRLGNKCIAEGLI